MTALIKQFSSDTELVQQLGATITAQLSEAIIDRGSAALAVSGGNSPKPLFQFLSQQEINWKAVTITLVDERWVDENHTDSNANLVKSTLLQNYAAPARFINLYDGSDSPFEAEAAIDKRLQELNFPLDGVVLGMGEDGHTASFFPDATTLQQALFPNDGQKCCAIEPPHAPHARMTLTLPSILNSQRLFLHFTGENKHQVLKQAMSQTLDPEGLANSFDELNEYPIRSVLFQNKPPLEIFFRD